MELMAKKHTTSQGELVTKVLPRKVIKANEAAIESYQQYKKTADLMERLDLALGRKTSFKSDIGSTLNFEINRNGVSSTTAQAF